MYGPINVLDKDLFYWCIQLLSKTKFGKANLCREHLRNTDNVCTFYLLLNLTEQFKLIMLCVCMCI